jgi:hypothetical protein
MSSQDDDSKTRLGERAYRTLDAFFRLHADEVVDIEILPPAIQPPDSISLQDGLSIGIPKKILALAFVRARELFLMSTNVYEPLSEAAFEATPILLLFDPEHITAANFRKKRLLALQDRGPQAAFEKAVNYEILFLDSILTSPLHRQSKSPTLWHHRTWLLDLMFPVKLLESPAQLLLNSIQAELSAVMKAGERHPKNYYAWQYARRLFGKVSKLYSDEIKHVWEGSYQNAMSTSAVLVMEWCCKHPSDISGWSFLHFNLNMVDSSRARAEVVKSVIDFAIKLELEQESIWTFLRTILAGTSLEQESGAILKALGGYAMERSSMDSNATKAMHWIHMYSLTSPASSSAL